MSQTNSKVGYINKTTNSYEVVLYDNFLDMFYLNCTVYGINRNYHLNDTNNKWNYILLLYSLIESNDHDLFEQIKDCQREELINIGVI